MFGSVFLVLPDFPADPPARAETDEDGKVRMRMERMEDEHERGR